MVSKAIQYLFISFAAHKEGSFALFRLFELFLGRSSLFSPVAAFSRSFCFLQTRASQNVLAGKRTKNKLHVRSYNKAKQALWKRFFIQSVGK